MGYRSEVLIKIPEHRWKEFRATIKEKCGEPMNAFDMATIRHKKNDDWYCDFVSIYWDYVKWYPEYRFVDAVMSTMKEMHKKYGMSYAFARNGEEMGDVETDYEFGEREDEGLDVPSIVISMR